MTADMISLTKFKEEMQKLEKAFNFALPGVRLELLYKELKGMKAKYIQEGVEYLINNKPYMPINSDIILSCRVARERDWQEMKQEERQQAEDFFKPGKFGKGLGKDAITCINSMFRAETRQEKLDLMREMERKYPGIGYKEESKK